ncbi:PREDICTED: apolipoprotein L2-like [Elephantulus edwardii]|uniref:apolipoprotein L2-like n=1 Tax=Elephantulus edwardii TaxID=28737 RepID=UPI0003F0DC30|nr:PREDICTED: apolipoprotein L2-like [Elephantulus edwardii]
MEYVIESMSREELRTLLDDNKAWERVVAEAGLSRDEADELQKALNKLCKVMAAEGTDGFKKKLSDTKRLLREFPQVKMELEKCIRELHNLADKIQKTHRKCTISSVVANSTGIVSGALTITGLVLAPVTAGFSLGLMATGTGLGTVAAAANVSTTILDYSITLSAKVRASKLAATGNDVQKEVLKTVVQNPIKLGSIIESCIQDVQVIKKNIKAIKLAHANPKLAANAKVFTAGGNLSIQESLEVQKAFKDTVLSMTKGARIMGMATTGLSLLGNVVSLVRESKHLYEGAKAESAEELRLKAEMMEMQLEALIQVYEILQSLGQEKPQQYREQEGCQKGGSIL